MDQAVSSTGGHEGGTGGQGGEVGEGGSGGISFDNPVQLRVVDPVAQSPLEGIDVCIREMSTSCGTTNELGVVRLEAPINTELTFEYRGPGIRPHVLAIRSNSGSITIATTALSDANVALVFQLLGITEDPAKGIIVSGVDVANAVASLLPQSGMGPYYSGPTGLPDPNLTATTTTGAFFYGNVDAGNYEASVTAPSLQCATRLGVVGSQPNATPFAVEPGVVTIISPFLCH